jgi:hypothetical protein
MVKLGIDAYQKHSMGSLVIARQHLGFLRRAKPKQLFSAEFSPSPEGLPAATFSSSTARWKNQENFAYPRSRSPVVV